MFKNLSLDIIFQFHILQMILRPGLNETIYIYMFESVHLS